MLDKVFKSKIFVWLYNPLLFFLACHIVLKNDEVNGVVIFAYIAGATLILSSRLTDAMLPALLLCVFCVLEIVDLCNPDWGRYQWATELFGDFLRKL